VAGRQGVSGRRAAGRGQSRCQDPKVTSTQPVLGKAGDTGREEETVTGGRSQSLAVASAEL
jgi:hypothetical protein